MSPNHLTFYTTLATLFPIMLLALTLQSSAYLKNTTLAFSTSYRVLYSICISSMIALLCVTEGLVLHAIYTNTENLSPLGASLVLALAAVFMAIDYVLTVLGKTKHILYALLLILGIIASALFIIAILNLAS